MARLGVAIEPQPAVAEQLGSAAATGDGASAARRVLQGHGAGRRVGRRRGMQIARSLCLVIFFPILGLAMRNFDSCVFPRRVAVRALFS